MTTISTRPMTHKISKPETMECGAAISSGQMEKFVSSFQQSTRRWEIIVYPAMFAFVILAGYGFFLIYSLTHDMSSMARSMDPKMGQHMGSMTESISTLSEQIQIMSGQVQMMTRTMSDISVKLDTLQPMLGHIAQMDHSMINITTSLGSIDKMMTKMDDSMTRMDGSIGNIDSSILTMDESMQNLDQSIRVITSTTDQMRRDLTMMNHGMSSLSRPASFANNFMPW
ncbi:hypothetical protein QUF50_01555 [Thiotrichales bacterium HSG1]|nr:hypothetical protein [Thiotrichales bacterium HSG1]